MTFLDAVRLGRVSNLPTVWTNTLAGVVLAGGSPADLRLVPLILALSLAYVGGMYLNDAFDAEIDRRERPHRPVPAGRAARSTVFAMGYAMLAVFVLLLLVVGLFWPRNGSAFGPMIAGTALAAFIVLYDRHHKQNPVSPVLMGVCRALVYVTAGVTIMASLSVPVAGGALLLLSHIVGLTYLAKQETLGRVVNLWPLVFLAAPLASGLWLAFLQPAVWPFLLIHAGVVATGVFLAVRRRSGDIGRAVLFLLAGISLFDALMIAGAGRPGLAALAAAGFVLTLALQRLAPGT